MKSPKEMFRISDGYKACGYPINAIEDILENEFAREARKLKEEGMTENHIQNTLQNNWTRLNRLFKKEWGFEPLPKSYLG